MHRSNLAQRLTLVLLLSMASALWAADIPVNARIDAVKVYAEGASITRSLRVELPAGTHRLVFSDLPASLDPDTLRIAIASREVTLGGIEVEVVTDKDYVGAQERTLRSRVEAQGDRRAELQDEITTAETQLKLLDSLAAAPSGTNAKGSVDAASLTPLLNALSTSAAAARDKIRKAKLQQRELDKEIAKLNADLTKIATARKQTSQVRALVSATGPVSAQAEIEYSVGDAGWRWVYEARLDTGRRSLALGRRAAVTQKSGEEWQDAKLTLTTARPATDATTPQVAAVFLDLEAEQLPAPRMITPAAAPVSVEEVTVTSAPAFADSIATEYLADYGIPGRVTLAADGEPRVYPVAEDTMEVELIARVVPSVSRLAYLEALFTYRGEVPIQGGKVQLYRDGAFVGTTEMAPLLPNAQARVQFGSDERIRVLVRDEAKQSGQKGLLSKQRIDEHKQRFEITNYHAIPVTIEVVDRMPVAENKEVRVELLKGATPATQENLDGKAGVMLWRMQTAPQQTASVRHYYAVRYPADRELSEREEDE